MIIEGMPRGERSVGAARKFREGLVSGASKARGVAEKASNSEIRVRVLASLVLFFRMLRFPAIG